MQNRILNYLARAPVPEYWIVRGTWGWVMVSREVALHLMNVLRHRIRPRWVRFCDLAGSEICVRTSTIDLLGQNTLEQRANDRALRRLLEAEENGDGGYDYRSA